MKFFSLFFRDSDDDDDNDNKFLISGWGLAVKKTKTFKDVKCAQKWTVKQELGLGFDRAALCVVLLLLQTHQRTWRLQPLSEGDGFLWKLLFLPESMRLKGTRWICMTVSLISVLWKQPHVKRKDILLAEGTDIRPTFLFLFFCSGTAVHYCFFCFSVQQKLSPEKVYHLVVAPCFDKKREAVREEFYSSLMETKDVDCVLTSSKI